MSALTVLPWLAGSKPNQDTFNAVSSTLKALMTGLGAKVEANTALSVPDRTTTFITFDTVLENTDGCWDAAHANLLTAQTPGWYWIDFRVAFPAVVGQSERGAGVTYNGVRTFSTINNRNAYESTNAHGMHAGGALSLWLNPGDYVQLYAWQSSSATITGVNDTSVAGGKTYLQITWQSN